MHGRTCALKFAGCDMGKGKAHKKNNATREEFEAMLKLAGLTKTDFAWITNHHRATVARWNKTGVPRSMITWLMMYIRQGYYERIEIAKVAGVPSSRWPNPRARTQHNQAAP